MERANISPDWQYLFSLWQVVIFALERLIIKILMGGAKTSCRIRYAHVKVVCYLDDNIYAIYYMEHHYF